MARKQAKQQRRRGGRPGRRARAKPAAISGPGLYAKALVDPCEGPLLSIYPGEKGTVGRFVLESSFALTGSDTAFTAGFFPALNGAFFQSHLNAGLQLLPNWSVGAGSSAGYATINSIFNKSRPVASCIEVSFPSLSALNAVGEFTTACVAGGTFSTTPGAIGNTISPNDVFTISPHRHIVQRKVYEQKFAPATMDTRYNVPFDITTVDTSDCNAFFIAGRGLPALTSISVKWTLVVEGTAKRLSGMATSAVNTRAGSHDTALNVAAALHSKKPGWSAGVKDWFTGFANAAATGFGQNMANNVFGPQNAAKNWISSGAWGGPIIEEIEEFAPLLLTAA